MVARMRLVSPWFFDTMGVSIVSGRDFTADDRVNAAPVTIVNREFVKRYMRGKDPLRTAFASGYPAVDTPVFRRIVGVVGDVRYGSIAEEAEPSYYTPIQSLRSGASSIPHFEGPGLNG